MEELRLWSLYFAAWLAHHKLGDENTALEFTDQVLTGVRLMPFRDIELAALRLQGEALASQRRAGALPPSESGPDPVQAMLERAAGKAASLGYQLEQSRTLFASGQEFADRALYARALDRFEAALRIADVLEAGELSTRIREQMVDIHDKHGDVIASGAVLQEIESQLTAAGASEELAENLLAQGRLFNQTHRYPLAVDALTQALEHEHGSMTRARIQLELARAHYGSGDLDAALRYARSAVVNPRSGEYRRPNPLLGTGTALHLLAGVHRARGEFGLLRQVREEQRLHLAEGEQAGYLYEQGLDRLAEGGSALAQAPASFAASRRAATGAARAHLMHLSTLQLCALDGGQPGCGGEAVRQAHEALSAGGIPAAAAEGAVLRAQIQLDAGQPLAAASTLDRLLDEMLFLRRVLPGVLGGWYWQNRQSVFSRYLTLMSRRSSVSGEGFFPLLALSKIRFTENTAGLERFPSRAGIDADALRVLLARRETPEAGDSIASLNERINGQLQLAREAFMEDFGFLSTSGLQAWLDGLQEGEAVLTFHLGAGAAYALVGESGRVRRLNLARPQQLLAAVQNAAGHIASLEGAAFDRLMADLGERLLGPLGPALAETIYFVPAGPLSTLPLDALRTDGRFLAERHRVANLLAFPARPEPGTALRPGRPARVFVAGDPADYSGEYLTRLEVSREIGVVADIFVGPGLTIVQGGALLPDEFDDARFRDADAVHLAMPAYTDLETPLRSSLELSEPVSGQGRTRMGLADVRVRGLGAGLVFMSSARMGGQPLSGYDSRMGLARGMLESGAGAVIASQWTSADGRAAEMTGNFYRRFAASGDVLEALAESKRLAIAEGSENASRDWARLQIYID